MTIEPELWRLVDGHRYRVVVLPDKTPTWVPRYTQGPISSFLLYLIFGRKASSGYRIILFKRALPSLFDEVVSETHVSDLAKAKITQESMDALLAQGELPSPHL